MPKKEYLTYWYWGSRPDITNGVDHITEGDTAGSTVLCEVTRNLHVVLSPSCLAEDVQ